MSTKAELRAELKQARLEMSEANRTVKSRAINERLKGALEWSQVKSVHYFEPIKSLVEVDISGFIVWLEDDYPDIQLATTRQIGDKWEMISLKSTPPPEKFDVIIVPMLGFDEQLHRIGYGGGYYDKFLSTQPQAKKIGVCFEQGKIQNIPAESHDIPMHEIITEV